MLFVLLSLLSSPTASQTNCEDAGKIEHFDWDKLYNEKGEAHKPVYEFALTRVVSPQIAIGFDINLSYYGNSTFLGNDLPTAIIIDFQEFIGTENVINESGSCSNRLNSVYDSVASFTNYWGYSEFPYLPGKIGNASNYLSYPEPTSYWTLSANGCNNINYKGTFTWSELINDCKDYQTNGLIDLSQTADFIRLNGTLFLSLVSPWDPDYFHLYKVNGFLNIPFQILINRQINVMAATNEKLFFITIVAKTQTVNGEYRIIIFAFIAQHQKLINPMLFQLPPFAVTAGPSNVSATGPDTSKCYQLQPYTSFVCGQLFEILIKDIDCAEAGNYVTAGDVGRFAINFETECRNNANSSVCAVYDEEFGSALLQVSGNSCSLSPADVKTHISETMDGRIYTLVDGATFVDDAVYTFTFSSTGAHNHTDVTIKLCTNNEDVANRFELYAGDASSEGLAEQFETDNNDSVTASNCTMHVYEIQVTDVDVAESQQFEIQFNGIMIFYNDSTFVDTQDEFVITDTVYVQITFPDVDSANLEIFDVEINNVVVCTADESHDLTSVAGDYYSGVGCFSDKVDDYQQFSIIFNGVEEQVYDAVLISNAEAKFSFTAFDVGRDIIWVYVQLILSLSGSRRRRVLLSASSNPNDAGIQQIGHFADSTQVVAKRSANDDGGDVIGGIDGVSSSVSLKWIVIICVIVFVTLAINAFGYYCYKNNKKARKSGKRYQFDDDVELVDDMNNINIKK